MFKMVLLAMFMAGLVVSGLNIDAWAAQMDARINPNTEESPVKMSYQKTVFIEYNNGGQLFDLLANKEWTVSGTVDMSDPGVQDLANNINHKIVDNGSQARISDLNVTYDFTLTGRDAHASIDYKVILDGMLADYVITQDSQRTLIDVGWRGLTATGDVVVDGVEINIPLSIIESQEPELYDVIEGTEAADILSMNLINADFILEQPLTNWHFLFDPTGINVDASLFGLDQSISGFVVSIWTMGESSFREGIQVERTFDATIVADQTYVVRSIQAADQGNLYVIGFGVLDKLDDLEIMGVTPTPPEGSNITSTGDFPVLIIYGMAGMAAIGGVAFFIYSNRALKHEKQGQQGISPANLVGYQTSSSSGGYQTNRGEAQLRDESDYAQTRSVYDDSASRQDPPPSSSTTNVVEDATCGCAASADMGSVCDCDLQASCLCDATCSCSATICQDHSNLMK